MPQIALTPEQMALTWVQNAASAPGQPRNHIVPLITFVHYGHDVLSQFGMGLCGFSLRLNRSDTLMTVKAVDGGVPLVVFVTSATTTGCIEKFMDLLDSDRLSWVKDKYPWI